ncbi:MAG TPA: DUF1127 domain-containing protein [Dongiaceae bacterium]|nr:DUF1127 domain-containing protein [Dongiaceae bacterium]
MEQRNHSAIAAALWPRIRLARLKKWLHLCGQRSRQRRALATLSDHQLQDLGLTREEVSLEIRRPPWR